MRLHKLVDFIDIKIDEGISIKDIKIRSVEPDIEDKVELEEQVQESETKDSKSDDESENTHTDSRKYKKTK